MEGLDSSTSAGLWFGALENPANHRTLEIRSDEYTKVCVGSKAYMLNGMSRGSGFQVLCEAKKQHGICFSSCETRHLYLCISKKLIFSGYNEVWAIMIQIKTQKRLEICKYVLICFEGFRIEGRALQGWVVYFKFCLCSFNYCLDTILHLETCKYIKSCIDKLAGTDLNPLCQSLSLHRLPVCRSNSGFWGLPLSLPPPTSVFTGSRLVEAMKLTLATF